jgi:hypothetical protein
MLKCECDDWQAGFPTIHAQAIFCAFQSGGPKYDGKPLWKFCPWCAEPLTEEDDTTNGGGASSDPPVGGQH